MSARLQLDDLSFVVKESPVRKTVGITVDRDGGLILATPADCPTPVLARVVNRKRFWIYRKLAEKELLFCRRRGKEYVSGEGFFYLGRSYRLLLTSESDALPLSFRAGRFVLRRDERKHAQQHFIRWYVGHGEPWLQRRVSILANRIGVGVGRVRVRELGYRWGSCSSGGDINFHWRTLLLPPSIIEYVVAHELVHLHEQHHTTEFWTRLERAVPDFAGRRQWLAENGAHF